MQWLKVLLKIVKIHITNKKKNVLASLKFNTRKLCGLLMQTAAFYESDKRWTFSCLQLWKVAQVVVSQLRILNYMFVKTNDWLRPFHNNRQRIAAKWAILDSWHCDRVGMLSSFFVWCRHDNWVAIPNNCSSDENINHAVKCSQLSQFLHVRPSWLTCIYQKGRACDWVSKKKSSNLSNLCECCGHLHVKI